MEKLSRELTNKSKFVSYQLRHNINVLDKKGWCELSNLFDLYQGKFTLEELESIVENNDKKRFEFNDDKTKIRAVQGHSVDVDLELIKKIPPSVLYHGTKKEFILSIKKKGLLPQSRNHVHLSVDEKTAMDVASRRKGENIILKIDCMQMVAKDYKFYLSKNNVWLTDIVPPEFIYSLKTL